eukprot:SAG31_NODE_862_length_11416_cov_8.600336_13_plen_62_part_00
MRRSMLLNLVRGSWLIQFSSCRSGSIKFSTAVLQLVLNLGVLALFFKKYPDSKRAWPRYLF